MIASTSIWCERQHGTAEELAVAPAFNKKIVTTSHRTRVRFGTGGSDRMVRRVLRFPQYELIGFRSGVIVAD